jgi:hypothetical protein
VTTLSFKHDFPHDQILNQKKFGKYSSELLRKRVELVTTLPFKLVTMVELVMTPKAWLLISL